ncbi:hypothetical protein SmJEL517_g00069 [Synchytrium microbalum]|uniref:NTF2 domain-containing protein n=1 Tax=Synchytrium microbalum TaxID=1806994 RepID=A0A507CIR1_9FUNG|nr:uncharacterized protein SmJEL517_g00069 [Synchytrium microbalum]TPX38044.1 hypothetical protein SmJEL517_g00069 [Synchytrium microbalum]
MDVLTFDLVDVSVSYVMLTTKLQTFKTYCHSSDKLVEALETAAKRSTENQMSTLQGKEKELVDISCRTADTFVTKYYDMFDQKRYALNTTLYRETSAILWNGQAFSGGTQFAAFYSTLPQSKHQVHTYDSQPLFADQSNVQQYLDSTKKWDIIIQVSGSVKYADNPWRAFSQTFILTPDPDPTKKVYFAGTDLYRLT